MSFYFNLHGSTGKGVSNPGVGKLAFPSPRKCIQSSFDAFAALREDGSVVSWGDRSFNHLMAGPRGNCVWFPFCQWVPWFFASSFEGRNGVTGLLFHKCLGEKWDECQSWLPYVVLGAILGTADMTCANNCTQFLLWYFAYIYIILYVYIYMICIIYIVYLWLINQPQKQGLMIRAY